MAVAVELSPAAPDPVLTPTVVAPDPCVVATSPEAPRVGLAITNTVVVVLLAAAEEFPVLLAKDVTLA